MIVGLPPCGGPLKRVKGELILAGARPGSLTSALPLPWPTIAPAQRLRAVDGAVPASLASVQTGRPLVLIVPCLSTLKRILDRPGGARPSLRETRTTVLMLTGALP